MIMVLIVPGHCLPILLFKGIDGTNLNDFIKHVQRMAAHANYCVSIKRERND